MSSQTGRNEPCPCGSGKKYKNCCQKRGFMLNKKQQNKLVIGVLAGVALIAAAVVFSKNSSTPTSQPILPVPQQSAGTATGDRIPTNTGYTPQPPGPAPEGKVWSPEHGHWHDAATGTSTPEEQNPLTSTSNINPNAQTQAFTPQPPGPAPAGKVWSPEHGHWHDAPGAATTATTPNPANNVFDITPQQLNQPAQTSNQTALTPQPPGPVPEGKVWSPEHGHWHDAPNADIKVTEIKKEAADNSNSGESDPK